MAKKLCNWLKQAVCNVFQVQIRIFHQSLEIGSPCNLRLEGFAVFLEKQGFQKKKNKSGQGFSPEG